MKHTLFAPLPTPWADPSDPPHGGLVTLTGHSGCFNGLTLPPSGLTPQSTEYGLVDPLADTAIDTHSETLACEGTAVTKCEKPARLASESTRAVNRT
jgi:hypothetical protein